jgi:hypothetical protein
MVFLALLQQARAVSGAHVTGTLTIGASIGAGLQHLVVAGAWRLPQGLLLREGRAFECGQGDGGKTRNSKFSSPDHE